MSYQIKALRALEDNYIWVIYNQKSAIVVDPTLADPVDEFLQQNNLHLDSILLTHGHSDHIGGVAGLVNKYSPQIVDNFSNQLADATNIQIDGFPTIQVILTPGHMYEHVCYLFDNKHLFCGDTLFSLGCGRVFTNDYQLMYDSLAKLKRLDNDVLCYPAHEYTLNNLRFTLELDHENQGYYADFINKIDSKLFEKQNSLPTGLSDELKYNLFLRDSDARLWAVIGKKSKSVITNGFEYFKQLRMIRNNF